ncbi:DUF3883 domain-containing protein [Clostridium butyricum]|jgi:hypothetical protein|uniref:DUF3883 domain-containing protein n=1 Tax=Clostridium butyricum TaxID=1492 RepID=UPI000F51E867|nr:DUF3883 domain-containing protein [Clostridium butyricum]RQN11086.1 DUF3883 domain-containing protein [Clostridium butyricum]
MAKKSKSEFELVINMFDKNTQDVINDFLTYYKGSSNTQYKNAIYNMLFEAIGKSSVIDLTFGDYEKALKFYNTNEKKESSQDRYRSSFFKYLYAFDIMKNPKGFENKWLKNDWINHFNKIKSKKTTEIFIPALSFEELERIQEYINMECRNNKEKMKTSFICYILYYTDCSISELKKITTDDYKNGNIITNEGNEYEVPSKYKDLFTTYLSDRSYNGFQTTNDIILKLGNTLGIKNLIPQTIKNAKKQNSMCCSLCGKYYLSNLNNWISVNNKLVCIKCAEDLKKNKNCKINKIENVDIETDKIENNISLSAIIYTFDELRNKFFDKKVDYLKLHELQIEIGKLGEAYVYDIERKKLDGTKYLELVDNTPSKDGSNGFDILSYDLQGNELYIEVKTEAGTKDNNFYISQNEINTGKSLIEHGKNYLIYRVHDVLAKDKNDIKVEIIKNIFNNENYEFESCLWKVSKNKG